MSKDLEEIRTRALRATPAPWVTKDQLEGGRAYTVIADLGINGEDFRVFGPTEVHLSNPLEQIHANATFIANARSDIEDLLSMIGDRNEDTQEDLKNELTVTELDLLIARETIKDLQSKLDSANNDQSAETDSKYRDMLLEFLRAYGNVNGLDSVSYETELFRIFLKTCDMLGIKPIPGQRLQENSFNTK